MIGRVVAGGLTTLLSALLFVVPTVTITATPTAPATGDTVRVAVESRDVLGRIVASPNVTITTDAALRIVTASRTAAVLVATGVDSGRIIATWRRSTAPLLVADTLWLRFAVSAPPTPPPDTTSAPPLPPGTTAGILCDSIVVVHRTAAGAYYTLHTMALTPPAVDTVFLAPSLVVTDTSRPSAWVAVVVQGPNAERMQVAYLPGDTEVLKNACYAGPVAVFRWLRTVRGTR